MFLTSQTVYPVQAELNPADIGSVSTAFRAMQTTLLAVPRQLPIHRKPAMTCSFPMPSEIDYRISLVLHTLREKRVHQRHECNATVVAVPVSADGQPLGSLVVGHCVDISEGGMRILLSKVLEAPLLYIEPATEHIMLQFRSVILEVLRTKVDKHGIAYAGRFAEFIPLKSKPPYSKRQ